MDGVEWLIHLNERGESLASGTNFLARVGRVYVMDNHRLAPWCFWQHEEEAESWRMFHIDRHPDAADDEVDWQRARDTFRGDLAAYCEARTGSQPLFVWDSITRAVYEASPGRFTEVYMSASYEREACPEFVTERIDPWHLAARLHYIVHKNEDGTDKSPWWIDLDLDYFVTHDNHPLASSDFVGRIGKLIVQGLQSDAIRLVTIALSPETSNGWDHAEVLLAELTAGWPVETRITLPGSAALPEK